jgi:6-phosphofructokinase 1
MMNCIGVFTSGGDSPGMNAAIRAVVRTAAYHGLRCMGIERGYQGMMDGQFRPLGPRDVGGIIHRGGTMLHAARCRDFHRPEGRARAAQQCRAHGVDALVAIGGDGTYHGAELLAKEHGLPCIGLPGTIDNDIGGTDYTIGFDTAMNTAMEAIDRLRDTAASHDRIFFVEVMGRHSGYLATIAGLAGGAEAILVPEEPTDIPALIGTMRAARAAGKNSMIVVVAEGDDAGGAMEIAGQVRAHSEFDDLRVTILGHLQRGGSPTAFDRVLASRMGVRAVEALCEGATAAMIGIEGHNLVLHPFAAAWEKPTSYDPTLLRLLPCLSV